MIGIVYIAFEHDQHTKQRPVRCAIAVWKRVHIRCRRYNWRYGACRIRCKIDAGVRAKAEHAIRAFKRALSFTRCATKPTVRTRLGSPDRRC